MTRLQRAGSNTALFPIERADEAEAHLPAIQDAPRANARFSGAQPHRQRPGGAARATGKGTQASRSVGVPPGVPRISNPARFGLGTGRRLATKADFERLLQSGTRKSRSGYTLFYLTRAEGPPRLGILISRKHAARATVRNGIKRCIREAFRLEQLSLGALDVLVRPPYGARPGVAMRAQLRELFSGLKQ